MPDPTDPVEKAALPEPGTSSALANMPAVEERLLDPHRLSLSPGLRWRSYLVGEPVACEVGWCFHAIHATTLEAVQIHIMPRTEESEMRAKAWKEMLSFAHSGLINGVEAYEDDEYHYEVSPPPPQTSLKEWSTSQRADLNTVQELVKQLSDIVSALHDRGLVHLNLRPETIYVLATEPSLKVAIGGLQYATVYNQPGLIPVPVDPFYAPPEAAGLTKHSPGAGLRAWDWWAMGRIIQELVLGRHVLSLLLKNDVSVVTPGLRMNAESLLLERDPGGPRAGAVELMPAMDQRLVELLKGLLTSSRDGRWGVDEVLLWLAYIPVKDRYELGRNDRLFPWKDRMFTVPEAAAYFSLEANWADGVANLFDTDDPNALVHFVGERPEHASVRDRIGELKKFLQVPNWSGLPEAVTRVAVAAAAWLLLDSEGAKLAVCGHRLDSSWLKRLLKGDGSIDGVALIRAMTALPYIQMIGQADPDAARLLSTLAATTTGETAATAASQGWVDPASPNDCARLFALALEPDHRLAEVKRELQARFACTRDPRLQAMFAKPELTHSDLVVLASAATEPERFGFVTHSEWKQERNAELLRQDEQFAKAIFWLRLNRALNGVWPVTGPWPWVCGLWIAGAAGVWLLTNTDAWFWAGAAFAAPFLLRASIVYFANQAVRRHAPGSVGWFWNTPLSRCRSEALAAVGAGRSTLQLSDLVQEFTGIHHELAALALSPPGTRSARPLFAIPVWANVVAVCLLLAVIFSYAYSGRGSRADSNPTTTFGGQGAIGVSRPGLASTPSAPTEKPTPEELFFDDPRVPRVGWDAPQPPVTSPKTPVQVKPATSDQVALALIEGQRLMLPYTRGSVTSLIAVPVFDESGKGLVVYDPRSRRVVQRSVLIPEQAPTAKSWLGFENLSVFYAGEQPPVPPPPPRKTSADPSDLPEREVHRGAYRPESPGAE